MAFNGIRTMEAGEAPGDFAPAGPWVRGRETEDIPAIVALARRVYPPPHGEDSLWPASSLIAHFAHFPEGQMVVEDADGRILADATSLRVPMAAALRPHTWKEITDGGRLGTHDPRGAAFYGADIMVDPRRQGEGLGTRLYRARIALAKAIGCTAFVAGARIPGYHLAAREVSVESYVAQVIAGTRSDPTLSRQLKLGFKVAGLLPAYIPDHESLDWAVLICRPLV